MRTRRTLAYLTEKSSSHRRGILTSGKRAMVTLARRGQRERGGRGKVEHHRTGQGGQKSRSEAVRGVAGRAAEEEQRESAREHHRDVQRDRWHFPGVVLVDRNFSQNAPALRGTKRSRVTGPMPIIRIETELFVFILHSFVRHVICRCNLKAMYH